MTEATVACPHRPECPGCPWVGRDYADQLHSKRLRVAMALAEALPPGAATAVETVLPAPAAIGYRVQAKLMVGSTRSGPVLGLYAPGSHRVLDVSRCPLHDPILQRAIPVVRDALAAARVPLHGTAGGGVRYVLLRASVAEARVLVTLVSSRVPLTSAAPLARRLRTALPLAGLLVNENTTTGNVILGDRTVRVWGEPLLQERYGDVTLAAGPTAFVQANTAMATVIYAAIADAIYPTITTAIEAPTDARLSFPVPPRVLDLYCGVGGIALTLARRGAAVVGIEEVDAAVVAARANAERARVSDARFLTGRVEDVLAGYDAPVDAVTLNPPRKGCDPRVLTALGRMAPPRLVYLSCNPESFARDAARLSDEGFALASVQPFDLLPQTDHVEVLGIFRRRYP